MNVYPHPRVREQALNHFGGQFASSILYQGITRDEGQGGSPGMQSIGIIRKITKSEFHAHTLVKLGLTGRPALM